VPRSGRQKDSESSETPSGSVQPRKWIWFRPDKDGTPVCKKEFDDLPASGKGRLLAVMQRYLAGEQRRQDVDHLGDGLYELRTRVGNNHFRVLFFFWGADCVGLTAFYKNQQQTPTQDKKRAEKRRIQWKQTFGSPP
jgi:phage-related protein